VIVRDAFVEALADAVFELLEVFFPDQLEFGFELVDDVEVEHDGFGRRWFMSHFREQHERSANLQNALDLHDRSVEVIDVIDVVERRYDFELSIFEGNFLGP